MKENKLCFIILLILVYYLPNSKANGLSVSTLTQAANLTIEKCDGLNIVLSVNEIFFGCPSNGESPTFSGIVYIFGKESDGNWVNKNKITPRDPHFSGFGYSLAISKEILVVGSPRNTGRNWEENSGAVYVFEKAQTGWLQTKKLLAKNGKAYDSFGESVAISGNVIVVGSPGDSEKGHWTGAAYVFENKNGWKQTAKLLGLGKASYSRMGSIDSIGISGDVIVLGSKYELVEGKKAGAVYIFRKEGGNWGNMTKILTAPVPHQWYQFGNVVKITGNTLVVGSAREKNQNGNVGAVYVFEIVGNDVKLKK